METQRKDVKNLLYSRRLLKMVMMMIYNSCMGSSLFTGRRYA